MTVQEKAEAIMKELSAQRDMLGDRCAAYAGELAIAKARIVELEEQLGMIQSGSAK